MEGAVAMRGKPSLAFGVLEFWAVLHWFAAASLTALATWAAGGFEGGLRNALAVVIVAVGKGLFEFLRDNSLTKVT